MISSSLDPLASLQLVVMHPTTSQYSSSIQTFVGLKVNMIFSSNTESNPLGYPPSKQKKCRQRLEIITHFIPLICTISLSLPPPPSPSLLPPPLPLPPPPPPSPSPSFPYTHVYRICMSRRRWGISPCVLATKAEDVQWRQERSSMYLRHSTECSHPMYTSALIGHHMYGG